MTQNNKKTTLSGIRWAFIIEFLNNNEADLKCMLQRMVCPEMVRADVFLDNIAEGMPRISVEAVLPGGGNRVLLCSVQRPQWFYPELLQREIESISIADMMLFVANQVEVV